MIMVGDITPALHRRQISELFAVVIGFQQSGACSSTAQPATLHRHLGRVLHEQVIFRSM
jgi:hypothetical protein